MVLRALIENGSTIKEIASRMNLKNIPVGGSDQIQHQSKSIWHNKSEIDQYVRTKLNITDEEWEVGNPSHESLWYTNVAEEISKLRKDETITDWNPELRSGIWRLTHLKGIISSEPSVEFNLNPDDNPDIVIANGKKSPFWIANGSWKSWNHTIHNRPIRWGTKDENLWNILQLDDIVFCSATSKQDRPFKDNGIFMVGKVIRKFELDENDGYFPDSENDTETFFKYRFELKELKIVQTDNELLPLVQGINSRRAINHITNEQVIKDILRNLDHKWNIKFDSFQINPESLLCKDSETTLPLLSSIDIDEGYDIISKELLISKEKIIEIIIALLSDRHVLLAGPVGTGKTRLAALIPEIFWKRWGGYASEDYTATSEWSTLDVIGGILPKIENNQPTYDIQNGCVVETVLKNSQTRTDHSKYSPDVPYCGTWLVIDEFNRAEIDKAFGQLFTALRTQNLKIPTNKAGISYENLKILDDYRIIGTLNSTDTHFLFNLSDALKSRFAYIEVGIPTSKLFETEIYYAVKNALIKLKIDYTFDKIKFNDQDKKIIKNESDEEFYKKIMQAYYTLDAIRVFKKLGTAILQLIYQNLIVGNLLSINPIVSLDNALTSTLIPQIDHESSANLNVIHALFTNDLSNFFKTQYEGVDRGNYFESFEKILDYLEIPESKKYLEMYEKNFIASDDNIWQKINVACESKNDNLKSILPNWISELDKLKKSQII